MLTNNRKKQTALISRVISYLRLKVHCHIEQAAITNDALFTGKSFTIAKKKKKKNLD